MRLLFMTIAATCLPLACAAQTAIAPIAPSGWVTDADYPDTAIRAEEEGAVAFVLAIDEKGVTTDCTILQSSGSAALDAKTCELLLARARFRPARDAKGKPIPATYRNSVRWSLPEMASTGFQKTQVSATFHLQKSFVSEDCSAWITTSKGDHEVPGLCESLKLQDKPGISDFLPAKVMVNYIFAPLSEPLIFPEEIRGYQKVLSSKTYQFVDAEGRAVACEVDEVYPDNWDPCAGIGPGDDARSSSAEKIVVLYGVWAKSDNE